MPDISIAIVGGGAFTPTLCEALADLPALPSITLRLTARRFDRLRVIAEHCRRRILDRRPDWQVTAAPGLEAAVSGADLVILLVRFGGLQARAWDEAFPRRFGLVGDEGLGPGGFANAWRTVPGLREMADTIRARAPRARLLNLIAPLGITTRVLLEAGLDAVGLCELPLVTLEALEARLAPVAGVSRLERPTPPNPGDHGPGALDPVAHGPDGLNTVAASTSADFHYAGLNHLGWFWDPDDPRQSALRHPALRGLVDGPTVDRFGASPLHYFYEVFDLEAGRRLGLERRPGRAEALIDLSEKAVARFGTLPGAPVSELEQRRTPWFDRAVGPAVRAMLGGPAWQGFANLRNDGLIPELPPELVIEASCVFRSGARVPRAPGPLPPAVAEFLGQAARAELLAFRAASERSIDLLEQAIAALPLDIGSEAARALADLAARPIDDA